MLQGVNLNSEKFVITIGDTGTILSHFKKTELVERTFADSPIARQILDVLRKKPNIPYAIVLDNVEQNFAKKTFPPVNYSNAVTLAKKQLSTLYGSAGLSQVVKIGKSDLDKKSWIFLLVSITKNPKFEEWVEVFSNLPNKFLGIFISALESKVLLDGIVGLENKSENKDLFKKKWQIFVTNTKVSGLRISTFEGGVLVFSRVLRVSYSADSDVLAGNIEQEINNTTEYLRRLDFGDKDTAEVYIIISGKIKDLINQASLKNVSQLKVYSAFDVAQALKLGNIAGHNDNYSDVLTSFVVANVNNPIAKFVPANFAKISLLENSSIALKIGGFLIVAYLAIKITLALLEIKKLTQDLSKARVEQATAQKEFDEAKAIFNKYPEEFRKAVVSFLEINTKLAVNYEGALKVIINFLKTDLNQNHLSSFSYKTSSDTQNNLLGSVSGEFQVELSTRGFSSSVDYLNYLKDYLNKVNSVFVGYTINAEDPIQKLRVSDNLLENANALPDKVNLKFSFTKKGDVK